MNRNLGVFATLTIAIGMGLLCATFGDRKSVHGQGGMTQGATSASMGGALLAIGACTTTVTTIPGITQGMGVSLTPRTNPGSVFVTPVITSPGALTIYMCAGAAAITPASTVFDIRVQP